MGVAEEPHFYLERITRALTALENAFHVFSEVVPDAVCSATLDQSLATVRQAKQTALRLRFHGEDTIPDDSLLVWLEPDSLHMERKDALNDVTYDMLDALITDAIGPRTLLFACTIERYFPNEANPSCKASTISARFMRLRSMIYH